MAKWEYLSVTFLNVTQADFSFSTVEASTLPESQAIANDLSAKKALGLVQCLNALGEKGWELSFSLPLKAFSIPQGSAKLILKRQKL